MGIIYHIATVPDWSRAREGGEYRTSTRGRTLEQQGFIHASAEQQVAPVANAVYGGKRDLVVLVIDEAKVTPGLVYEPVQGWDQPFPHIYGPLNTDAVLKTIPLVADADGRFSFLN